jgi:Protein of unknown function (DUF2905)
MARLLIFIGLAIVIIGLLVKFGVPIGRLPGDIVIRRGNTTIAVPIVTSIILSIVLTLLLALFRR